MNSTDDLYNPAKAAQHLVRANANLYQTSEIYEAASNIETI
jgi:hypothetical protein